MVALEMLKVSLPNFEGPLDLLLFLVRKKEMDIRKIPISTIADEFMGYIEMMEELNMDLASEFLSLASQLMYLKSRALLPQLSPQEKEQFEKEKEELYVSVEEYQRLKAVEEELQQRMERLGGLLSATVEVNYGLNGKQGEMLKRVYDVFISMLADMKRVDRVYKLSSPRYSVDEKREELMKIKAASLREILMTRDKFEMIAIFLAVLELVKLGLYTVDGEGIFRRRDAA
ncbi:MAG: chromosome segregation protein ScpA [Thermotogae bacterium]|nr:MAG: chromosome segregation protein ScpA [Thermotogota bacterium]